MIDDAYEVLLRERRMLAARALGAMAIEDTPDAATVSRELGRAHEPAGLS